MKITRLIASRPIDLDQDMSPKIVACVIFLFFMKRERSEEATIVRSFLSSVRALGLHDVAKEEDIKENQAHSSHWPWI